MKSRFFSLIGLATIAGLTAIVGACSQSSQSSSGGTPAASKTIGVSIQDLQAQFYEDMEAGMKSEAAKYGYAISFVDANRDSNTQTAQVEDFISKKVDAIVLTPADSKAIGPAIVEANQANIPVFTADIASTASRGTVVTHVASDNVQGGNVAAGLLCKALGGAGTVAIIDQPEVTSVQDRVSGFRAGLAAQCPKVTIVSDQDAGGDRATAESVTDNLLQRYPNLSGIFGINDDSALGALAAVRAAGKVGVVKIVGYDATAEAKQHIDDGEMVGDPQQHPETIGKLTIDAIHDYFSGKTPPKRIPVPVGAYTGPPKPSSGGAAPSK
ncbi:MAG TPA: substrate-binding domain-containing protein [Candidatus Eremiobacteraceae bacterium]|nr:substrate-binding domain-containing protein [Candidatus Eremiobacteraceae bacterium]